MLCRGRGGSCHERAGHRASSHVPKLYKLFEGFRGFSLHSNLFVWTANGRKLTPVASILLWGRRKEAVADRNIDHAQNTKAGLAALLVHGNAPFGIASHCGAKRKPGFLYRSLS